MDSLVEIFCDVDDFCKAFQPEREQKQLASGLKGTEKYYSLKKIVLKEEKKEVKAEEKEVKKEE